MKRLVKRMLQRMAATVAPLVWRNSGGERLLILMYHRVLPFGHPDRATEEPGMFVSPESLHMHLQLLKTHFEPVFLDDWVQRGRAGAALPKLACAVTFDDGWRDNHEHAFPVIRATGVPAHIFLVADFVGSSATVWTARLSRLLVSRWERRAVPMPALDAQLRRAGLSDETLLGEPSTATVARAIAQCKLHHTDYDMNEFMQRAEELLAVPASDRRDFMNWEEVREMAASGLVRFGSHTRRHTRLLAHVDAQAMEDELGASQVTIEAALGKPVRLFCYPNGDYTPAALGRVAAHYDAAVTTRKGWNGRAADPFQLKRIGLHEDVAADEVSYLSRLSGWI